jgi:hypothetical protein
MLLSIFTAVELQVICLIFSQCRPRSDVPDGSTELPALASASKEPELNQRLAPIASEIRR